MPLLFLEATGPKAEELALAAGEARGIPVGWDGETATFDADGIDDEELRTVVFEQLAAIDPGWGSHLRLVE